MRLFIDRWLTGPASLRTACAGGWLALLVGTAYGGLAPLAGSITPLEAQLQQQAVTLHNLQRQRAALPDRQREAAALEAQLVLTPFSPHALNTGAEGHLIRWQPQGETGELELALAWPNVPAIFAGLARSDMLAHGFALRADGGQTLRLTLQLGRAHEK
ncbi:hypothetical protein ACT47M_002829 [Cronobacter muytjensii]